VRGHEQTATTRAHPGKRLLRTEHVRQNVKKRDPDLVNRKLGVDVSHVVFEKVVQFGREFHA
jgi:hypothetical protein